MTNDLGRDPLSYMGASAATATEVNAGTKDNVYVSPLTLDLNAASTTQSGVVRLATVSETQTGTADDIANTPAGLAAVAIAGAPDATSSTKGITELSTDGEAVARSVTTPLSIPAIIPT